MKKIFFLLILSFLLCSNAAFAIDQIISLKDGSSIKGELVGVNGTTYTIRTQTLGDIKIESSKISSISDAAWEATTKPVSGGSVSSVNINQKIENAQAKIMNNPQAMASIQDMMNDPQLMQLLTDPSITQAVMARDVQAIENNPKAKELVNHPKMQAFMQQVGEQQ